MACHEGRKSLLFWFRRNCKRRLMFVEEVSEDHMTYVKYEAYDV